MVEWLFGSKRVGMKGLLLIVEKLSVDEVGEKAEKLAVVDKKLTGFDWTLNPER